MRKPKIMITTAFGLLLLAIFLLLTADEPWKERERFVSPQKTNTIVVEYDFISRPTVYKEIWLWKKKIWTYEGGGFNEELRFQVEWLSENLIRFRYQDNRNKQFDESFLISIP